MMIGQAPSIDIETLGYAAIVLFILAFLACFAIMVGLIWLGWYVTNWQGRSPYTGQPMRRGEDIAFGALTEVQQFLNDIEDPENPVFHLEYAVVCRETGCIFFDGVNICNAVRVDWSFIKKRHDGHWVSWGSLLPKVQAEIRRVHDSLRLFQTEESCSNPRPQDIDLYHAMLKPGPLYVDLTTKMVMGWQVVPGTQLQILVVKRPRLTKDEG